MRIGLLSDIHSNPYALSAVLEQAHDAGIDEFWLAGDTFGYYPWATATFDLVAGRFAKTVLGNHDRLVARGAVDDDAGIVAVIAAQNAADLSAHAPQALGWLRGLPLVARFGRAGARITIAHGTPTDPIEGRFYPDDASRPHWLPGPGEVVILGQTHHPIIRGDVEHGLLVNPGSVGQPRDGDPMPSWALLDLSTGTAELQRAAYDHDTVMRTLHARSWDQDITRALARWRSTSLTSG
jgi:predicted phosphodiesterase